MGEHNQPGGGDTNTTPTTPTTIHADTSQSTQTQHDKQQQPTTNELLAQIVNELQHISDNLNQPAIMQIAETDALNAWGLRMYETEFLDALELLGIEII